MVPLDASATAAFALVLGTAGHSVGWPVARGGSQFITQALLASLRSHGGDLRLNERIRRFEQLPKARAYLFDLTPDQVLAIAGQRLHATYRRRLARFRHGAGVFKMDWALSGPIPWTNPTCARSLTVHLAGDFKDISAAERAVHRGELLERPFVLVVQPTLFDPGRAPAGRHIAWAYCHVPCGSNVDRSGAIEAQIERLAPGFRELVLARASRTAVELEHHNPNLVGGDIAGGASDLRQLFFRPVVSLDPYAMSDRQLYFCSSSTPPGGGVHGMCGYWAARSALVRVFKRAPPALASQGDDTKLEKPAHAH
jgi:phytoene dehydrogenase-like protein